MIADAALATSGVIGAPRIELTGVCKAFGGVPAVIDMSLAVSPGYIHALVGENSAGKSTVMNMVSGVLIPDSGEIRLDGAAIALTSAADPRCRDRF
jgi:ABC-type sugar transport system ATPase subunit